MSTTTVFVYNGHDAGYDLVPGHDVTNEPVGKVFVDDGALVLMLYGDPSADGDHCPDDAAETNEILRRYGYTLDERSIEQIDELLRDA